MTVQFKVGVPESDTPPQVLGTIHYVLASLGTQLGDRYDSQLRNEIGPQWLRDLGKARKKFYTLHDPHFVLSEPLKFPDSPVRSCLPSGGAFYNLLEDTLRVRNAWSHFEIPDLSLDALKPSVETIRAFAHEVSLPVAALCSTVTKRINAIANGQYHPETPPVVPADMEEQLVELERELKDARNREDALAAEVAAAQVLLDESVSTQGPQSSDEYVKDLEKQLEEDVEKIKRLEFLIESLAAREETPEHVDGVPEVLPGQEWKDELPARRTVLMGMSDDLFDEARSSGVADEFGEHATQAIGVWRELLAPMSAVFLTPDGHAVAHFDGVPIYLGCLGDTGESSTSERSSEARGFFIPHTYTLRLNGNIEDRETGDTLTSVNPTTAKYIQERLLEAVPRGGRLRVTTQGEVARHEAGTWVVVCSIGPADWFPGHL